MSKLKLSVLDICPVVAGQSANETLKNSIDLAGLVDGLGYHRFWFAEHHSMAAIGSSSPEIMIAQVASATSKLRVGAGGIMLPNHTPLRVAENFKTLEALFPGRIDLGLGRAPGTDMKTALALRGTRERLVVDRFPDEVTETLQFLTESFPAGHNLEKVIAMPQGVECPSLYILGSSDFGARFAGERGLPYAFAQHFSPLQASQAFSIYRDSFRPSQFLSEPYAILTTQVLCADTDEEADELSKPGELSFHLLRTVGKSEPLVRPEQASLHPMAPQWQGSRSQSFARIVGSPARVVDRLQELIELAKPQEIMALTIVTDHQARKHSYKLLADFMS